MGVAYTHGLFVTDLAYRPTWKNVTAALAVLQRWGFGDDAAYASGDDELDEAAARESLDNLLVVVGGPEGELAARLMGPSLYDDVADEDRYVVQAELHVGSDFKVIASVEGDEVDVTTPPTERGEEIRPQDLADHLPAVVTLYKATWDATRPTTDARDGFDRVWRCGLLLECDKDVPAIARDAAGLPSTSFVRELEQALGARLVELGWHH